MNDELVGFILFILVVGIFGLGVLVGAVSSTKDMTASQYTQAQDKCKEHEGVYSVGVSSEKVKV